MESIYLVQAMNGAWFRVSAEHPSNVTVQRSFDGGSPVLSVVCSESAAFFNEHVYSNLQIRGIHASILWNEICNYPFSREGVETFRKCPCLNDLFIQYNPLDSQVNKSMVSTYYALTDQRGVIQIVKNPPINLKNLIVEFSIESTGIGNSWWRMLVIGDNLVSDAISDAVPEYFRICTAISQYSQIPNNIYREITPKEFVAYIKGQI